MPLQVIIHKGRDEVIGMIVALMHAQRQADAGFLDCLLEQPGAQAIFEEAVGLALIDQEFGEGRPFSRKLSALP